MRYQFMRFPGGKMKALTLSYDDGIQSDKRLVAILNKYGIKCTFNINTSCFGNSGNPNKLQPSEIKEHFLDTGHEIAVHGESHIAPGIGLSPRVIRDVLNCRTTLENEFGMIIRGMAYPDSGITKMHNGNDRDSIFSYLKSLGIAYARTLGGDNDSFAMPENFYAWMPTAHHINPKLLEWADSFVAIDEENTYITRGYPRLFYLWGHSYEFNNNDNWDLIEKFCEKVSNKDDIWYATNIEIYEYTQAYNSLITSADGCRIYNPSLLEVFLKIDNKSYSIKSGETLVIS